MLSLFGIVGALSAWAHIPQDGDVYLTGSPTLIFPRPGHYGLHPYSLGGAEISAEGDIGDHSGIEISMIYMPYLSSIDRQGLVITERVQRLHISTGYRYWFTPHFSAYLGFFSAYSMGEPEMIQNDYGTLGAPPTSAADSVIYGFDGAVLFEPVQWERLSMVVEARYGYCLTRQAQEDENFASLIVGIKYFLQSRQDSLKDQ